MPNKYSKLKPYIFRQAAECVDKRENGYCCPNIRDICRYNKQSPDLYLEFIKIFMPTDQEWRIIGLGMGCAQKVSKYVPWWRFEDYQPRILALLLCAEMCKKSGA